MPNTQFITESSVPQGSHVGPFLYTIMCYHLPNCTLHSDTFSLLYADDTKFAQTINSDLDYQQLQSSIDKLTVWSAKNRLQLNLGKTRYLWFSQNKDLTNLRQYYIGTDRIQQVEQHIDLGVLFDEQLTFIPHIEQLSSKTRSLYGAAYRFAKEIKNFSHKVFCMFK